MRAEEKNRDMVNEAGSRGSLTVEALLFLIPFMIAFFTLINAARFVQAEMLIHHAVTQTAKQISAYSYVLTKTEISDRIISTNKKSADFQVTVEKSTKSLRDFANAMGDMDSLVEDVLGFVKNQGEQRLITKGVGMLTKNNIKSQLSLVSDDPNEYLENIGIEGDSHLRSWYEMFIYLIIKIIAFIVRSGSIVADQFIGLIFDANVKIAAVCIGKTGDCLKPSYNIISV